MIINITEKMLRKFDVLDKNWYAFEVVEIDDKTNKNGKLELRVTAKVLEGECAGAEVMMFFYPNDYSGPFVELAGAVENTEITAGMGINPYQWVGKQFWSEAKEEIYDGKRRNKFEEFLAIGNPPAF